jgi:hypothetical protein
MTLLSLFKFLGIRRTLLGWVALALIRRLLKTARAAAADALRRLTRQVDPCCVRLG